MGIALERSGPVSAREAERTEETATAETGGRVRGSIVTPALLRDTLRAADLALAGLLGLAIYFAYVHPEEPQRLGQYLAALAAGLTLFALAGQGFGLYRPGAVFERALRAGRAVPAWALTFAVLLTVAFALKVSENFSRVWTVGWFASGLGGLVILRLALGAWIGRAARAGRLASRTVILGTGPQAETLAARLAESDTLQTRVLGLVEDREPGPGRAEPGRGILGGLARLEELIRAGAVDQVILALPWQETERVRAAATRLALLP
ncbi:MAG TPA: hypothetical protein VLL72_10960, partial [Kiloniellales bacterium]|nr:hypothetical protein [Kiloniellales bacterium]